MKVHESITGDRVADAIEISYVTTENPGICLACGADHDACEPDAEKYKCYECGQRQVYGVEQILLMGLYH